MTEHRTSFRPRARWSPEVEAQIDATTLADARVMEQITFAYPTRKVYLREGTVNSPEHAMVVPMRLPVSQLDVLIVVAPYGQLDAWLHTLRAIAPTRLQGVINGA